ncbi:hypothetical protein GWI33_009883, partial [Rhynchophorus ferrugineus]
MLEYTSGMCTSGILYHSITAIDLRGVASGECDRLRDHIE